MRRLWLVAAVPGLLIVLFGALALADGYRAAPQIDPTNRCPSGVTGRCLSARSAYVVSVDGNHVTLSYSDGLRTMGVRLVGDSAPAEGRRVRYEAWDGLVVSIFDPSHERRYRTNLWPRTWDPYALVIIGLGVLATVGMVRGAWVARPPR